MSAFGWVARCMAISGSSTSLICWVCHGALNRASRARTRRPVGGPDRPKEVPDSPAVSDGVPVLVVLPGKGTTLSGVPADPVPPSVGPAPSRGGATSLDTGGSLTSSAWETQSYLSTPRVDPDHRQVAAGQTVSRA